MARYVVHIRSPLPVAEAFAFMADLRNFARWDPGVVEVHQVEGDGGGADAVFDVAVKGVGGPLTLRYHTTTYTPPERVVARAETSRLTSLDTITVRPDGTGDGAGSIVTYDAVLELNGILGVADPVLKLAFNRIGGRAAAGLIKALDGQRVAAPTGSG